jgi:hypothetical protein
MTRSAARSIVAGLAVCGLIAACAVDSADPGATPTPAAASRGASPSPSSVPSASASTPDATPAPDAAPPELAGRWRRNVQGETVILTLDGNGYHIQRGPEAGAGRISVTGDTIEFSGSNICPGVGTYTWAIVEGRLRLEIVDEPCTGRSPALARGTFGRLDP